MSSEMSNEEILSRRIHSAYGCLCHSTNQKFSLEEEAILRMARQILSMMEHDFNRWAKYDVSDKARNKKALEL